MVAALRAGIAQADEKLERLQGGGAGGRSCQSVPQSSARFDMPLTLLVPDLLAPADAPAPLRAARLPALEKALSRAIASREPGAGASWLLSRFGLPGSTPLANLAAAAEGLPAADWLRADPVHQRIERDALVLHDPAVLDLARGEADEAIAALNGFFGEDGLAFVAPHPHRWYVRVPEGERPVTVPFDDAVGANPFGRLPSGGTRLRWRSMFSEAQMLLAGLPLNAAREARGAPALNGVWFWGEGDAPMPGAAPFSRVLATDPVVRGLALAAGTPGNEPPATLAALPPSRETDTLVVLDALTPCLRRADPDGWIEAARRLEGDWFSRLLAAIPAFGRIRIVLPAERETRVFDLDGAARWRWFARTRALATHA